jgi:hypothetical protein
VQKFDIVTLRENPFDQLIYIPVSDKFGEDHSLIDAIADQRQRKIHAVRFYLRREAMDISILIDIRRRIKEDRAGLIKRVRHLKRRVARKHASVHSGYERFERNSAWSIAAGYLFFQLISKLITARLADPRGVFFR